MDDQKLFTSNVELTTELVGLPVDDSEAFVVWIEDGLQKLQFGLQPRNRHLPLISGRAAGEGEKSEPTAATQSSLNRTRLTTTKKGKTPL